MASPEEIKDQQELLTAYRRTLAQYRKQEALNGEAFMPPAVTNGIQEARAEIQQIKSTLCGWGVVIEDHPDDEELPQVIDTASASGPQSRQRVAPVVWVGLAGALLALIVVVVVWQVSRPTTGADQPSTAAPATVEATPVFVTHYAFDTQEVGQIELVVDPERAATIPISGFLSLSRLEFGYFDRTGEPAWNIRLRITNTSPKPITLDLDQRFFVLNDDQGRAASLASFCCATKPGDLLAPGEGREVQLLYRSVDGWYGKGTAPKAIFIRVTGLLPVVRAVWSFPPLATGG
jgi:hypothetical protein